MRIYLIVPVGNSILKTCEQYINLKYIRMCTRYAYLVVVSKINFFPVERLLPVLDRT